MPGDIAVVVDHFQCGNLGAEFTRGAVLFQYNRCSKYFLHLSPHRNSTEHSQFAVSSALPRESPSQRRPLENNSRMPTVWPLIAAWLGRGVLLFTCQRLLLT